MKANKLLIFLIVLSFTACRQFEISVDPLRTSVPTGAVEIPSNTAISSPIVEIPSTATAVAPSPTLAVPTTIQTQQSPPTVASTSTVTGEQNVEIVLIALEDNGQSGTLVGCGDSAIPIHVTIPRTQGVLRATLEKLFSAKQQFYGESGYYNALYQSDLQVAGVSIEQGKATIRLTGTIMLGGTCDAPRLEAQIEQTALQFSTVSDVAVFVNDVPLEEVLSTR